MQNNHKIIVATAVTLAVLVGGYIIIAPSGPNKEEQRIAVERAITHDKGLSRDYRQEVGLWGALFGDDDAIRKYVARLRLVPLENCPADFAKAYQVHIAAWESGNRDAIEQTWNQVVYIAYEYGVEVE